MWNVGEPALLVDHRDGLLGAVPWRDSAFEVEADNLAISVGDLFADDHLQARVHLTESLTALDGVVVGDAHRAELRLPREIGEVRQQDAAVTGVLGVHMHVESDLLHGQRPRMRRAGARSDCRRAHEPPRSLQRRSFRDRGDAPGAGAAGPRWRGGPRARADRPLARLRGVSDQLPHPWHPLGESPHPARALPARRPTVTVPEPLTLARRWDRSVPDRTCRRVHPVRTWRYGGTGRLWIRCGPHRARLHGCLPLRDP